MYLMIGGSFFEGIFKQYGNDWFWQSYVASSLITFPIVLLILLIYNMKIEGIKKQLADMQDELDDLNDLKTARVVGIKEQLSNVQKQLDHMNSPETDAQRGRHREAREQLRLGWCYYYGDGVEKISKRRRTVSTKPPNWDILRRNFNWANAMPMGGACRKTAIRQITGTPRLPSRETKMPKRRLKDSTADPA